MDAEIDPAQLLTLKQVRVIDAVARLGGTARAADDLNMSQPTVSRHLAAAEFVLGVRLFQRGWAGAEPTSEGDVAVLHAGNAIRAIRRAEADLTAGGAVRLVPYLDWRHLDVLDQVIRLGSTTEAAKQAGLTQPAISRTLTELDGFVGQDLFHRHRSGLTPLPSAAPLSRLRAQLLAELAELPRRLEDLQGVMTGRVSVGISPFSAERLIPEVFGELSDQHPHLRLLAMYGTYEMLAEALIRGEIDCMVGLTRQPSPYAALEEIPLFEERYCLIAAADHPAHATLAKQGAQRSIADLHDQHWVVAPHGTPVRAYFEGLFDGSDVTPPAQTCEMLSFNSAEQVLLNSRLIAVLPYSATSQTWLHPGLKILDLDLPNADVVVGATVAEAQARSAPVEMFLEAIGEAWWSHSNSL